MTSAKAPYSLRGLTDGRRPDMTRITNGLTNDRVRGDLGIQFTLEAQICGLLVLEDKMKGSQGRAWGEFQGLAFEYVSYKGDP